MEARRQFFHDRNYVLTVSHWTLGKHRRRCGCYKCKCIIEISPSRREKSHGQSEMFHAVKVIARVKIFHDVKKVTAAVKGFTL